MIIKIIKKDFNIVTTFKFKNLNKKLFGTYKWGKYWDYLSLKISIFFGKILYPRTSETILREFRAFERNVIKKYKNKIENE